MDNLNNAEVDSKLTMEQRDELIKTLSEEVERNEDLKVLAELPSNNNQEEHVPEEGKAVKTLVNINPFTGEKTPIPSPSDIKEDKSLEEVFGDMSETLGEEEIEGEEIIFDITADDIKNYTSTEDTIIGKYDISDETALELMRVVNRKQEGEEIKYKDLPNEVKEYVDNFLKGQGVVGFSNKENYIRNQLTDSLLEEFITQIGLEKLDEDFNKQIENIYEEAGKEMSPLFKEYNTNKNEYLTKLIGDIEDEGKKKMAEEVLDAINDAYTLNRFKNYEGSIKIKKYFLEEPDKVYKSCVENKYKESKYHIYKLEMIEAILDRHLKQNKLIEEDDTTSAKKIMLAFAKYCENFDINIPKNHAFMYYFTYNIVLLDIYKGEDYDGYAVDFLNNVLSILKVVR